MSKISKSSRTLLRRMDPDYRPRPIRRGRRTTMTSPIHYDPHAIELTMANNEPPDPEEVGE